MELGRGKAPLEAGNRPDHPPFSGLSVGMEKRTLRAVRNFSLICVLLGLSSCWLAAQRLPDTDLPPPPPTGLSDEEGVLGRNSAANARIIGLIRDLEKDHGYRLYVILKHALISTNPSDLAAQMQQEWLPDGGGLVFVYESDTRNMGFGRGLDAREGLIENESGVPAYKLVEIISNSLRASEGLEATEPYLEKLITEICGNLKEYFARKEAPADGSRSLRLALVTIGALSLLALCGMGLGWLMGKAETRQSQTRAFPEIEVPERLSAPYGGGCGGTGYFGPPGKGIN